jgi:hypothetical protein
MKKLHYILVLSIIFTGYLFSQTEENETIKVDTFTKVDTVVVEQQEKKDFEKYDFYNDYLSNLPKTNDTPAIDSKKTGIFSARFGSVIANNAISFTLDIPIIDTINFAVKYFKVGLGFENGDLISGFGLGLGYVASRSDNVILRFNIYPSLGFSKGTYVINDRIKEKTDTRFGLNLGGDIILWKVFSVGLDFFTFNKYYRNQRNNAVLFTVGLGWAKLY